MARRKHAQEPGQSRDSAQEFKAAANFAVSAAASGGQGQEEWSGVEARVLRDKSAPLTMCRGQNASLSVGTAPSATEGGAEALDAKPDGDRCVAQVQLES